MAGVAFMPNCISSHMSDQCTAVASPPLVRNRTHKPTKDVAFGISVGLAGILSNPDMQQSCCPS